MATRGLTLLVMAGPLAATGAGGSVLTLMAMSGWYNSAPEPPPTVPATKDGAVFDHWALDDVAAWSEGAQHVEPNCTWWNGSVVYTSDLCSHFSLSRMASNSASRAIARAVQCAAFFETECVISPEVGVSIPAAFVYNPEDSGMRMLIAPRILPLPDGEGDPRTIRVQDPEEKTNGHVTMFNHTIKVEYLPGGSRAPVSEVLNGSDAYCVQMLRAAFAADCWAQLD